MTTYRVVWEIDVEADSPRAAAIAAMRMQDEHTTANVFSVTGTERCTPGLGRHDCRRLHPIALEVDLGNEPRHLLLSALDGGE